VAITGRLNARPNFEHHLCCDELAGLCAAFGIIVKYVEPNNEAEILAFGRAGCSGAR
jgi:hypothetical protein